MSAQMVGWGRSKSKMPPQITRDPRQTKSANPPSVPGLDIQGLREVTILSKQDWDRIERQLNRRQDEEERVRRVRAEKERLHQLSKDRVKNWANTIAGERLRKLEARKIRETKEEEEKQALDIEEEKFQAEKRKEAIEKAKTQMYYQTDRVKSLHTALKLTEVLKERDAQIELNKLKESAGDGQDKILLKEAQENYEAAILRAQEEAAQRIAAARENANFQKAQIREHLAEIEEQKQDEQIEADELKRLAAQTKIEKEKLAQIRNAESKQLMAENQRQIDDVRRMKEIQRLQEEEEDEECRIFAGAKRKMMKLRAEKEKELHLEKQQGLEKIREKLRAQMQQVQDDEDDRIKRAVKESEEKRAKEEEAKELYSRKMQKEIAEHRATMMKEKEEQAKQDRKMAREMLLVKKQADALFISNEEEKKKRRLEEAKRIESFYAGQINERKHEEEQERKLELAIDEKNKDLILEEEKQYQEYAARLIDHCEKRGRNTYPLKVAAKAGAGGGLGPQFPGKGGIRPSYLTADYTANQMPHYQCDTTDKVKHDIHGDEQTGKRLGFVW